MKNELRDQLAGPSGYWLGAVLIAVGLLFLASQLFRLNIGAVAWPFFVIVPGLLLCVAGLGMQERSGEATTSFGVVVTMVGLLLFYQNSFDHFASWAYAWALVAPTALGIGQMLFASVKNKPELMKSGARLTTIGLALFLVGALFFELIIGVGGFGLGSWAWPLLLILVGGLLLARNLIAPKPNN